MNLLKSNSFVLVISCCLSGFVSASPVKTTADRTKFISKLVKAAEYRATQLVVYNGAYKKIAYPNGDVHKNIGVCTDVIIRSYRQIGIDLQVEVHQDMRKKFTAYPSKRIWNLTKPDTNIDHRRVPNLRAYFKRHGKSVKISQNSADYKAGDLVTWILPGNLPHIGIVINKKSKKNNRPLIVHNIGLGPKIEDMIFDYKITGHYRYYGKNATYLK